MKVEHLIENSNRCICFTVKVGGNIFKFVDNYLMFNNKLSSLPDMFFSKEEKEKIYKEFFPYEYYTE